MEQLETEENWEGIRSSLSQEWEKDSKNAGLLNRLALECWYVLAEWNAWINTEGLEYKRFKQTLISLTQYGLANIQDDPLFLCFFGYMISLFPFLFYENDSDELFIEWEEKGKAMLRRAYALRSGDPIIETLYYGSTKYKLKYKKSKKEAADVLVEAFPGNTAIEQYFRFILTAR